MVIACFCTGGQGTARADGDRPRLDPVGHIIHIHAAGGHHLRIGNRAADCLNDLRAEHVAGEHLEDIRPCLHRHDRFAHRHHAGHDGHAVMVAELYRFRIKIRGDDVLRAV